MLGAQGTEPTVLLILILKAYTHTSLLVMLCQILKTVVQLKDDLHIFYLQKKRLPGCLTFPVMTSISQDYPDIFRKIGMLKISLQDKVDIIILRKQLVFFNINLLF